MQLNELIPRFAEALSGRDDLAPNTIRAYTADAHALSRFMGPSAALADLCPRSHVAYHLSLPFEAEAGCAPESGRGASTVGADVCSLAANSDGWRGAAGGGRRVGAAGNGGGGRGLGGRRRSRLD